MRKPHYECHIWSKAEHDQLSGDYSSPLAVQVCKKTDGRIWTGGDANLAPGCDTSCKCCRPGKENSKIRGLENILNITF